jgi:ABC-2 type transport system ATP-binding protein
MSLLVVSRLRKSFDGQIAVDDLSFEVNEGEIFGLLGPNGAGKTTTMMILAGLRRPDAGTVSIAGRDNGDRTQAAQTLLGVVPQELAIYPDLTARENLEFFGRIYGVRGAELGRRIARILDQIGLSSTADQYVHTFSGGMKRRLNFGAALLHQPRLVILDEPTVGVDPQSRSHLLDCVRQLGADGVGVIYASHYMEEVEVLCHRVAIIDHGKLLACGKLDELLDRSRSDLILHVRGTVEPLQNRLRELADVTSLNDGETQLTIRRGRDQTAEDINSRLERILKLLREAGVEIASIETKEHNLERLFLELTGRKLRD